MHLSFVQGGLLALTCYVLVDLILELAAKARISIDGLEVQIIQSNQACCVRLIKDSGRGETVIEVYLLILDHHCSKNLSVFLYWRVIRCEGCT